MTLEQYRKAIHSGPYAWPGGYPLYFVTSDGAALCFKCAKNERREIIWAIANNCSNGWKCEGIDVNWEDTDLHCDHCSKPIETAYDA